MAKKTSVKNKDILKGTNAADVLTVKHSQVTVNAGKGNDKINVNSGSKHRIYSEAGNDTIIVAAKAGSGSKIYGDDAKNKLTGKDTFTINGGKKNYFYGGKGTDTFNINGGTTNYIYGGAGNDVIVIGKNSTGTAFVKDFNVKSGNTDKIKVNGGTVKSVTLSGKNLIVKGGKSASIKLENAASKKISLQDSRGSYTASNTEIKLGKDFTGTMDATKYLSTVTKIDGRNATKKVNITGNAKANTIYAGKAGGTIKAGAGNDTINMAGGVNSVISGGAGTDTFNHTSGTATIKDYEEGETLSFKNAITKVTFNDRNITLTSGTSGSMTVENGLSILRQISEAGNQKKLYSFNYDTENGITGLILSNDVSDKKIIINEIDIGGIELVISAVNFTNGANITASGMEWPHVQIHGSKYNDILTITGSKGATIEAGDGNDKLYGGDGGDFFLADDGDDYLYGGNGLDNLSGGNGNDFLYGDDGNDQLYGQNGDDHLYGGKGNDILFGDEGQDWLYGNYGSDKLYGGNGNDHLYGGEDNDYFCFDTDSQGNSIIYDYEVGLDIIKFNNGIDINSNSIDGSDVLLNLTTGGTININNAVGQEITFDYGNDNIIKRVFS